ncbi:hydantoinase B/oxoprolinase family protein [Streptosporangium sp. NPDC051022]|uniref:hydantoinase B/oxoprolinase family protein n=1 Tax=Streptosporangium sp. NPDC051022 TaxID=3155752 RepID=UPI0034369072
MADPVMLEILRHRLDAVTEDMARVMERTALSTFIKETADFAVGIVAVNGELISYPWHRGAPSLLGGNLRSTLALCRDPHPGDIYITNDPYLGGPICSHLTDLQVLRPIFHDGELLCWAYSNLHAADIGGAVPSSIWVKATEIYQEGLRLRPLKIFKGDVVNEDLRDVLADNSRTAVTNWGDIQALCSAVRVCEARLGRLIERYGHRVLADSIDGILDYAGKRAEDVIAQIPDGAYEFSDYLESDLHSDVPIRIKVRMTVTGSRMHLDYTGTDPQLQSPLNLASGGEVHPYLCLAVLALLVSLDPEIPKSSAIFRPVGVTAPEGSLVNASYPAAVGLRYATAMRIADAVFGCLAEAMPGRMPAGTSGMISPVVASVPSGESGHRHIQVVEPLIGGGAGRAGADGLDGVDGAAGGYLRNTPVEIVELEVPVVVRRYCLDRDTAAAGRFRGGSAVVLEFEALRSGTVVLARALERFELRPWGVAGGGPGNRGTCQVRRRDGAVEDVGKIDQLRLEPGESVIIRSPSGGGYGPPALRSDAAIAADLDNELISEEFARRHYGVLGRAEDGSLVRDQAPPAGEPELIVYGAEREALERRWPPQVQDRFHRRIVLLPLLVRDAARHHVYRIWTERYGDGGTAGAVPDEWIDEVWDAVVGHLRVG